MTAIPTHRVSLPNDGIAYWLKHNSSTTQILGTDAYAHQRCIVWNTAGGQSTAFYSGRTMYALVGVRLVTGNPGRFCDWHTQPNDSPHGWSPPCSFAVAPLAIDYSSSAGMQVVIEPEDAGCSGGSGTYKFTIFTQTQAEARRGQWIWLWLEVKWGRSNELPDGSLKVWVAGEDDSPRINVSNINTHWFQEHQVTYLLGSYWSSGSPTIVVEHAATRFGRTPQECFEDVPVLHSGFNAGSGSPGSHENITSREHDEAAIPADIDWTGGGGDVTPPAVESAAIFEAGSSIIYDEPLMQSSVPAVGDYDVRVNGVNKPVSSIQVVGTEVRLFFSTPVISTDTVTVSYTRVGGREVKDLAGNLAANLTNQAVTNNTPPVVNPNRTAVTRTTAIARGSGDRVAGIGGGGI